MPWETAVVNGRFYLPHRTSFTMAPDTGRGFTVTATAGTGAPAMEVEAASYHRTLRLLDAASRSVVLTVQEPLAGNGRRWVAFRGRSTSRKHRLFAATKKVLFLDNTTNVDVFLPSNRRERERERKPDFAVHGSFRGGAMTVSRGYDSGAVIALIDRESTGWVGTVFAHHTYTLKLVLLVRLLLGIIPTRKHSGRRTREKC